MRFSLLSFLIFLLPLVSHATVRMSLTAGTPCEACHYQQNGGGGRTEMGWESMNKNGLLTYDQLGLTPLHKQNSNSLLGHNTELKITPGLDFRMQGARFGAPSYPTDGSSNLVNPDFSWIPMQAQVYLGLNYKNFTLYGSLSPSKRKNDTEYCKNTPYPGMTCYQVWAGLKITSELKVRIGRFQPSIGIQHDDHTMTIRSAVVQGVSEVQRGFPIIPPTYAEFGGEINYQPMRWFKLDVGAFDTSNLKASINQNAYTASADRPLVNARLMFLPQFSFGGTTAKKDDFDDFDAPPPKPPQVVHSWLGASVTNTTDFNYITSFVGLGIPQGLSMVIENSMNQRINQYKTNNSMISLFYAPKNWLSFHIRAERATTQYHSTVADASSPMLSPKMWQYVAGFELFLLPYLEIRPEYRWIETQEYRFAYTSLQVHLFY